MSSESAIVVDGVSKTFSVDPARKSRLRQIVASGVETSREKLQAVRNVSFTVGRGETVGIVGRNGAGKSTLLRIIGGITTPDSGSVTVNGKLAMVMGTGAGMQKEATGRDNIYLRGRLLGLSDAEIAARYDWIIDFADIGAFIDRPLRMYSKGMRGRLAFAITFSMNPDILVIDESMGAGDTAFRRKTFARLVEIKESGATILFVSHSVNKIAGLADRAILIHQGEKLAEGPPKGVIDHYQRLLAAGGVDDADLSEAMMDDWSDDEMPDEGEAFALSRSWGEAGLEAGDASGIFDPGLARIPAGQSVARGAEIRKAGLRNESGEPVNVLAPQERCRLSFNVRVRAPTAKMRFGVRVKTEEGFEIGGALSHPEPHGIAYVAPGNTLKPSMWLHNMFAPGTYYIDLMVFGVVEGKSIVLHQVTDALVFRSQEHAGDRTLGVVDIAGGNAWHLPELEELSPVETG